MEAKIKKDLKVHLDKTAEMIRRDRENEWQLVNIPEISEKELMSIAGKHGLENDEQTRAFCKFISIGTNFASLDFAQRIQTIPVLIKSVKELVGKIEAEIKEFADIANLFSSLIQSFIKLVINTKHNMRMALPHLEESVIHMTIMSEAMMPESDAPLGSQDLQDIDLALTNMSSGILKLLEHAKSSKEESVQLDKRISGLKDDIESKITVTESRISFAKLMPKIGATAGLMTGATVATGAVESVAFGGAGALVLGGFTFPPLGAILLGAGVGAIGIGGLIMLIFKLWEKHQFKALAYLREILFNLNKLNNANLAFMEYMNRSEEDANKILTSMDFFVKNVKNGSHRYRRVNNDICLKAIDSTNDIIKCINNISGIQLAEWIDEESHRPNYTLESAVPDSIQL